MGPNVRRRAAQTHAQAHTHSHIHTQTLTITDHPEHWRRRVHTPVRTHFVTEGRIVCCFLKVARQLHVSSTKNDITLPPLARHTSCAPHTADLTLITPLTTPGHL